MKKYYLLLIFITSFFGVFFSFSYAEGTYANIGTSYGTNAGSDAVSWSQGNPIMVDSYGKIVVPIEDSSGAYAFAVSNNNGSTWNQHINTGIAFRPTTVYDPKNDVIHVVVNGQTYVVYRRFTIKRDQNYNITQIVQDTSIDLNLETIGSCTLIESGSYPVIQWKDNGANGILAVFWSVHKTCGGTDISESRGTMRTLSNNINDNTPSNWSALNGTPDSGIGNANVPYNKLYTYAGSTTTFIQSALIRGGSGSKSEDIYFFNYDENGTIGFRRLGWNGASGNWSGSWTTRNSFSGNLGNSNGYNLKQELLTKPVFNPADGKVYVGLARWKDNTNGDTQSLYTVDGSDNVTLAGDVYSAGGAAWFAPTLDIMFNSHDNKIYTFFQSSAKDPTNPANSNTSFEGKAYYKSFDGSTFNTAQSFFSPVGYTVDIPIVYKDPINGKIFLTFRADGPETPYVPPHFIFSGYIAAPGYVAPAATPIVLSANPYVATTYADFNQTCAALISSQIINTSGGEVTVAANFRDDFETPRSPYTSVFDDLWDYGQYSGATYNPAPNGSLLVNNGAGSAYVLGKTSFNKKSLEFRAKFTANNSQHIGWVDSTGFNDFMMFSTFNNGQLNIRDSSGGNVGIGSSYLGSFHTYRIDWGNTTVEYFVDNVSVGNFVRNNTANLFPIFSENSGSGASALTVDWLRIINYPTSATYQSCPLDAGVANAHWGNITFNNTLLSGTAVIVETRVSNDNSTWSSWTANTSGSSIATQGRYLQYRISFTGTSTNSPTLNNISIAFNTDVTAPTGTLNINSGAIATNNTAVTLNISATDNIDLAGSLEMMISNDSGFAGGVWETYATSKAWNILSPDGAKTVYIKFRDTAGNVSTTYTDSILLDIVDPALNVVSPTDNSTSTVASFTITGTTDIGSTLTVSVDSGSPISITVDGSGNWSYTTSTLNNGSHSFSFVATDSAGNTTTSLRTINVSVLAATTIAITTTIPPDSSSSGSGLITTGASISIFVSIGFIILFILMFLYKDKLSFKLNRKPSEKYDDIKIIFTRRRN